MEHQRAPRHLGRTAACAAALATSALALGLLAPALASAATLHVTSAGDTGAGTLRAQIAAANPNDIVEIDAGVNPTLTSGEIAIDKNLTVVGQGAAQTTVSASAAIGSSTSAP